jgi:hypothetical protein
LPRCSGCGTGSTTKARPPLNSRRWPNRPSTIPPGWCPRYRLRCEPMG